MKNLSLILNGVLIIAVGALYYLHFDREVAAPGETAETAEKPGSSEKGLRIAYVRSDSLEKNYTYIEDLAERVEKKQESMQRRLLNKEQELQREYQEYQANASGMSGFLRKQKEELLMKKQQELMTLRNKLEQELVSMEQEENKKLMERLINYLQAYNKEKEYTYILNFMPLNNILLANDSLDITEEVLNGLNDAYDKEKEQQKNN